jgi:membrane-associated phospholipid phosphatase
MRIWGGGRGAQVINAAWCGAIICSTLTTKQHVVLDVLAGAALGGIAAGLHLRYANWSARGTTAA